jgi:hypothetical protein
MKELLKKIAENKVEEAFTDWRFFSPEKPKILKEKIENKKVESDLK